MPRTAAKGDPMKKTHYDTIVIGCGTAGIFAGYELHRLQPGMDILLLEQGHDIRRRTCPIVSGKVPACINCPSCDIMNGFGGAGAFSDGKYNFTTKFGGWLSDYLPPRDIMDLIEYVDTINVAFGASYRVSLLPCASSFTTPLIAGSTR